MSIFFNFSFIQPNSPAPYLITPTSHAFIPAITFPPFTCDLRNFFAPLMYSLFTFFFISLFMMESNIIITIATSSEKILMVWVSESNSLSLFAYRFKCSINKKWLNFGFWLVTYLRFVSFKIIDNDIRATTKSKGEKEPPWKIPVLISLPLLYQLSQDFPSMPSAMLSMSIFLTIFIASTIQLCDTIS